MRRDPVSQLLDNLLDNALKYSPDDAQVELLVRKLDDRELQPQDGFLLAGGPIAVISMQQTGTTKFLFSLSGDCAPPAYADRSQRTVRQRSARE